MDWMFHQGNMTVWTSIARVLGNVRAADRVLSWSYQFILAKAWLLDDAKGQSFTHPSFAQPDLLKPRTPCPSQKDDT
jgi:hypothetical protein